MTTPTVEMVHDADGWLTDASVEAIEATMPKCPQCGGGIAYMHMVEHQLHAFSYEIDGLSGDIIIHSELYDRTFCEAEQDFAIRDVPRYVVECENGHQWPEARLKRDYYSPSSAEKRWSLKP